MSKNTIELKKLNWEVIEIKKSPITVNEWIAITENVEKKKQNINNTTILIKELIKVRCNLTEEDFNEIDIAELRNISSDLFSYVIDWKDEENNEQN